MKIVDNKLDRFCCFAIDYDNLKKMLSPKQQASDSLNKSQNILIPLRQDFSADSLGSALALALLLKQIGKNPEVVTQQEIPSRLSFLPGLEKIKKEPSSWRDFIISIDTSQKHIRQLRYETKGSILKIYLGGPDNLEQKDIRLEPGPFLYDLIITLGTPDLETIGPLYEKYSELFFEKPILNIDHRAANEHYGEINLIEPTAGSSAEIIADLINSFFPNQITPEIATCLLAGIVDETHSFQKPNATPQTFSLASFLISQGAEKETIVQSLYKTKPLNYLKLWGRLLTRLDYRPENNLAWTEAYPEDFLKTQTAASDLLMISQEIYEMLPQLALSAIFWQKEPQEITIILQSPRLDLLQKLSTELNAQLKNHRLIVKMPATDMALAKNRILGLLI